MKPRRIHVVDDVHKADQRIFENLKVCASHLTLSRKLLNRFPSPSGTRTIIIPEWVEPEKLFDYSQGSIWPTGLTYGEGEGEDDELSRIVEAFLESTTDGVAVCENSGGARKRLEIWDWSRPPRYWEFGDHEIYYIVQRPQDEPETINAALGDSLSHWGTAVCSTCKQLPGDSMNETFLDEIVQNTKHILMSAFDGDGYLIWSPDKRE